MTVGRVIDVTAGRKTLEVRCHVIPGPLMRANGRSGSDCPSNLKKLAKTVLAKGRREACNVS